MKNKLPFSFFFIVVFFFLGLQSDSNNSTGSFKPYHAHFTPKAELFILDVTTFSSAQSPGESLMYSIRLKNLSGPVANAEVQINDPISRVRTSVKTGADGTTFWSKQIPLDTKPQLYVIEFFYENAKQYSKVAVLSDVGATKLTSYPLDLSISKILDDRFLVIANRGGFTSTPQPINTTLREAAQLGLAIAKDFFSKPSNILYTTVALVTCYAEAHIPPTLMSACGLALKPVLINLGNSVYKTVLIKGIKASDKFTEFEKEYLIKMVELTSIAFTVATLNPAEGISNLEAIESGIELLNNGFGELIYENGTLAGASFPAQRKGSDQVFILNMYNRGTKNSEISQTSKDPNCKGNNTGDYCFQNNSKLDLQVRFYSSPNKTTGSYTSPYSCTIQPGQKQCFFDVPAGVAGYEIKTPATFQVYKYGDTIVPNKEYYGRGSLYVDKCEENTFFINLETPSYSSNIPIQTNENETSRDSNCKERYTGDYCFLNTTGFNLELRFNSSPNKNTGSYTSPYSCTLQPGQKQCFFDVPAGPASYEIKTSAGITINAYGSTGTPSTPKTYFVEGQLYVDPCRGKTFIIK